MAASARNLFLGPLVYHNSMLRTCSKTSRSKPVLTLFTKKNEPCSLCDVAKEVLAKYNTEFIYEEQYIDAAGNQAWYEQYKYDIPVVHLDGRFLMKHKVDETLLVKALQIKTPK